MKTILFNCSYLDDDDKNVACSQSGRFERNRYFLDFYEKIMDKLGVSEMWFVDNASDINKLKSLGGNIYNEKFELLHKAETRPWLNYIRYDEHLVRISVWNYPYVYRALRKLPEVIRHTKCNKVLLNDTDFFILNSKTASYVERTIGGFVAFWTNKYKFPELALCILCEDNFEKYEKFVTSGKMEAFSDKETVEAIFPFTKIEKDLVGDRWDGERKIPQTPEMDFYGQWQVGIDLVFDMK